MNVPQVFPEGPELETLREDGGSLGSITSLRRNGSMSSRLIAAAAAGDKSPPGLLGQKGKELLPDSLVPEMWSPERWFHSRNSAVMAFASSR